MSILGLDIGGANIKAADPAGHTVCRPFAIWKHPEQLAAQISSIGREFPEARQLAITMTAELADCFETKAQGVRFILDQVQSFECEQPPAVWTTAGRFVSCNEACQQPMQVAAANWHALATWVGQHHACACCPFSLLIDIGTTTTDIIAVINGRPASVGLTDLTRLQSGELCYSGIKRTPLCAVAHSVPFRDGYCSLAAELFATTLDIHLLLGHLSEDETDLETANGKPATRSAAHDRIARSLCADRDEVSLDEAIQISAFLADVQRQRLAGALERVVQRLPGRCETVVISGCGAFLARSLVAGNRQLTGAKVVSLDEILSPGIAEAACAYAVSQLASAKPLPAFPTTS
jgi:probable H4MPT-linked C1 transfer pathway protein